MVRTWRQFGLGALAGGVFVGALLAAVAAAPSLAGGRVALPSHAPSRLSVAEQRRVHAILTEARETRAAAIAYFAADDSAACDAGGAAGDDTDTEACAAAATNAAATAHAAEVDDLVNGVIQARLVETLGPARAALAQR